MPAPVPPTPHPRRIMIWLRRIVAQLWLLFLTLLPTLPVIAYLERDNLPVVFSCFAACAFAGVVLNSWPIICTLLGALFGSSIPAIGRRADWDAAVFAWALLGLGMGLMIDALKRNRPAKSHPSASAERQETNPLDRHPNPQKEAPVPSAAQIPSNIYPCLFYDDAPAAIEWLCRAFGFTKRLVVPGPEGSVLHAELSMGPGVIMVASPNPARGLDTPRGLPAVNQALCIQADDPDAHFARAKGAGAAIL